MVVVVAVVLMAVAGALFRLATGSLATLASWSSIFLAFLTRGPSTTKSFPAASSKFLLRLFLPPVAVAVAPKYPCQSRSFSTRRYSYLSRCAALILSRRASCSNCLVVISRPS